MNALRLDPGADPSDVHYRISAVLGLPRQILVGIESLSLSMGLKNYLSEPIAAISKWVFSASGSAWREEPFGTWMLLNEFRPHWKQHLLMISEELTRAGIYVHVPRRSIDEIEQLVGQLKDLMEEESELPREIVDFIRARIDEITEAIALSQLQGSMVLHRVVRSTYGDLLLHSSEFEGRVPAGDSRWRKFWEIVHKVAELAQVAQLVALPVATVQLVELAEQPSPPAIVAQEKPSPRRAIRISPGVGPANVPQLDVRENRSDVVEATEP